MDYHMRWRHVVTCCRVMCAYYAYVTIRRALGVACFGSRHFVNTVSGQHFSAENKQEAAEFDSQHLPMHFRGVIWKIKSKSNFPVSFSLINAEMNLVGNYRTLRGLRTVNPEGLPSTRLILDNESIRMFVLSCINAFDFNYTLEEMKNTTYIENVLSLKKLFSLSQKGTLSYETKNAFCFKNGVLLSHGREWRGGQ